ncbi:ABC transporter [Paractinoplanes abujensis]|uniref:Energy-coupling factor transporter ATP-binding protein EcfA2 n=2 Tax=Paractinoplanes abujensis TaxID=882441 RepID=A0A7W7G6H8_9ACTN|nr:energy-coupling factor transporter ATP-binding protein EcfA2 [Actinoplanes abujensis]GID21983.1 ABC transporter [Actinoplanes abujensis]
MTTHGDAVGPSALSAAPAATQDPATAAEATSAPEKAQVSVVSADSASPSEGTEATVPRQPHEKPEEQRPTDLGEADARIAEAPPAITRLADALSALRAAIAGTAYPLVMPSAEEAQRIGTALTTQLDDYLLPRLARLDAPLLVVIGGSTGAGKSTLVNSLVRAPVSSAGVLRPTTRSPVLVSNPADLPWFQQGRLLPGLVRTREPSNDANALQLVSAPALGAGLAFLDAPDIDSVVDRNRKLAAQLLAAADLWLFVTTAARYADAVPWELLTTARLRGTVIALVLDRVPAEAAPEIATHLQDMLNVRELGAAPLFVLPETRLDGQGLIGEDVIRPLHDWFGRLAADATARSAVVRQTLDGALISLGPAVAGLADAADEQARAAKALGDRVTAAYRTGRQTLGNGLQDGRLLRGEVLARWQEFVGTGEFLKTLESKVGQLRDRFVAALTGRPAPGRNLQMALESQLVTLLRGIAADAAEQAYSGWQAHPAGAALLDPGLQRPAADLPERADRLVRDWQQWVLGLVRAEGAEKRVVARGAAYAVNGAGLAVMIAVFTSTAFIPTGLEVAAGAGSAVAAQKVLEAIFGDQAIRTLATQAREDLLLRAGKLFDEEAARFTDRLAAVGLDAEPGARLRQAAADVETARGELALTGSA